MARVCQEKSGIDRHRKFLLGSCQIQIPGLKRDPAAHRVESIKSFEDGIESIARTDLSQKAGSNRELLLLHIRLGTFVKTNINLIMAEHLRKSGCLATDSSRTF